MSGGDPHGRAGGSADDPRGERPVRRAVVAIREPQCCPTRQLIELAARRPVDDLQIGTAERFDVFANLPSPRFPGGRLLRKPALVAGMLWYALRDRL